MKNLDLSKKVVAAAVCGLFAGVASTSVAKAAPGEKNANYKADDAAKDDHVCKGCASASAKHECKGKNACKTLGGCKSGDAGCASKNSCKGKGGCAVPAKQ